MVSNASARQPDLGNVFLTSSASTLKVNRDPSQRAAQPGL